MNIILNMIQAVVLSIPIMFVLFSAAEWTFRKKNYNSAVVGGICGFVGNILAHILLLYVSFSAGLVITGLFAIIAFSLSVGYDWEDKMNCLCITGAFFFIIFLAMGAFSYQHTPTYYESEYQLPIVDHFKTENGECVRYDDNGDIKSTTISSVKQISLLDKGGRLMRQTWTGRTDLVGLKTETKYEIK